MNPIERTNQKPTIDIQSLERKEHKHTSKENHQTTREETKRRKKIEKNYKNKQKTNSKMAVSIHLSIITMC